MSNVEEISSPIIGVKPWFEAADELRARDYSVIAGESIAEWAGVSLEQWEDFAEYWNRLTPDRFMGDGGTYRLRRYGQFETASDGTLRQLPHASYEQPSYINRLNGGIAREFEPLESGFAQHAILHNILNVLMMIVNDVEWVFTPWNVKLHPYRIVAKPDAAGQPTPEGLHRDGVNYIVSMMVKRANIIGGESSLTDAQRTPLDRVTLAEPMHLMILNDENTMHEVTPVSPVNPQTTAYRDVLVIAFAKVFND
ncbi:MAG: 2OG-Fe dioxygenase family protein [Rhodocyclaceae bacterium]|nr:2OG-Fe dioxygenase family protein [Rhodocyclaceae bacterium]